MIGAISLTLFISISLLLWIMNSLLVVPIVYSQEENDKKVIKDQQDIIEFNVGGKNFQVARSTIENSDSVFLKNMISEKFQRKVDENGYQFIDSDEKSFEYLIYFIRNFNLSDKAIRNINDAHRTAIYFSSEAMIDATMNTKNFSCSCEYCDVLKIKSQAKAKKLRLKMEKQMEKLRLEKEKLNKEKFEKLFKDNAKKFKLSFDTDLKVNGQESTKHYYWSKVLPGEHAWPDTKEKRNSLCPPPSRLPTSVEYEALGKKMKSAGYYNPNYFASDLTDPVQHQSFHEFWLWSSESYGYYNAWVFGGNNGYVYNDNRSGSEAIRCVVVVD